MENKERMNWKKKIKLIPSHFFSRFPHSMSVCVAFSHAIAILLEMREREEKKTKKLKTIIYALHPQQKI